MGDFTEDELKDEIIENNEYVLVRLSDLKPYENNPRLNAEAVPVVESSIEDFGYRSPITVNEDMVILGGHTRYEALMRQGRKFAKVLVCHDMNEVQQKGYRLADNKTQEKAGWDNSSLMLELKELKELDPSLDMGDFGFGVELMGLEDGYFANDEDEEDIILEDGEGSTTIQTPEYDPELDDVPEEIDQTTWVQKGDIIHLGINRLMCGDSTSPNDMEKLMDGEIADITFTSPPYNASSLNTGRARDGKKYRDNDDNMPEDEYTDFLEKNMTLLLEHSEEIFYNIGILKGSKHSIIQLLYDFKDNFKDMLYWKKSNPVPALAKNHISSAVELIIAFGQDGSRMFRKDPGYFGGVFEGTVNGNNEFKDVHRAVMPLYLPLDLINHFTDEGQLVLDCFGGMGTTLIACKELGRRCNLMEIDPVYCRFIVERYVSTGGDPESVFIERNGKKIPYEKFM